MKKILYNLLACVTLIMFASGTSIYAQTSKRNLRKRNSINLKVEVDSVKWLRERYCDMLKYDLSRAGQTIDHLQRKFAVLPKNVQDTLLASHYKSIVTLFEQERNDRAYAFADCYYALCEKDDPNLGTLYLNDIVLAIENSDTVKLRLRMNQLSEYAERNNLDYDSDLADAEANMNLLRHRIKFKETPIYQLTGADLWMVDMTEYAENDSEWWVQWYSYIPHFVQLSTTNITRFPEYAVQKTDKKSGRVFIKGSYMLHGYGDQFDKESKTFYTIWGHERTKSADPMLLAGARQTVQDSHVLVAGELAKKKYSFGEKLGGNVAATLVDAGLNALFDWLSVTTEYYYRCEMSLTMTQPDLLEGTLAVASTTVKSNDPYNPKTKTTTIPLRYYRMYPQYGYCYMQKDKPLYSVSSSVEKYDKLATEFTNEIQARKGPWKEALKDWKMNNKGEKYPFKNFCQQYNYEIISYLREKAENSLLNSPLTQP